MKPGSDEAIAKGCLCPVLDNNHGRFPPAPPDHWWINEDCPIHAVHTAPSEEKLPPG